MRTRGQSGRDAAKPPPPGAGGGAEAEVATGGANRRRTAPAAKGKSPAKVEIDSPLGCKRKKGKVNTEWNDDADIKTCSAGSSKRNNLEEEEAEAIGNSDAADVDWEEGHISAVECEEGYSHELGETVTVEFNDVPSSAEKKSVRRPTAEEKEQHRMQGEKAQIKN